MISPDRCIAGLLLLLLGVYFLGFYRTLVHRSPHAASVFLAAFSLAYLCSMAAYRPSAANHARRGVYVALSAVLGLQMSLLMLCLAKPRHHWFGRAIHGCVAGLALALYISGMAPGGLVIQKGARAAYAVIWCAACTWAILVCSQWMDTVCAVILGAYLLPLGVDCFAHTAYVAHVGVFFFGSVNPILGVIGYAPTKAAFGLQAAALILAASAGALRYWWSRRRLRAKFQGCDDDADDLLLHSALSQ
ncbi:hypothetical protein EV175_000225 [Coemansia sp. RSA 1933]|nr:hypothetical protein EV175_000225 [Coemansia sp. RSA 1933]